MQLLNLQTHRHGGNSATQQLQSAEDMMYPERQQPQALRGATDSARTEKLRQR